MLNHLVKLLELYPEKPWNWYRLSSNSNITWDIVEQNLDKPWNWDRLSRNPNITWDIVKQNPDKPWDWRGLSSNSNITWDIVEKTLDKPWDWGGLSSNTFNYKKIPKLPKVSQQQKALILDLEQNWFGIPPGINKKPVFVRGGPWCHEAYEESKLY